MPPAIRKAASMKDAKMLVVPKALKFGILDNDIPDKLVSEEMAERYLEITPPVFSLIPDYQLVINEIEQSYVIGNDFSALSASCVVIERILNQVRIALHRHHKDKVVKKLWNKDAVNEWYPNIDALKKWAIQGFWNSTNPICRTNSEVGRVLKKQRELLIQKENAYACRFMQTV